MGQLERYGLYVLCLVIFLILGVAIWGDGAQPEGKLGTLNPNGTSLKSSDEKIEEFDQHLQQQERQAQSKQDAVEGLFKPATPDGPSLDIANANSRKGAPAQNRQPEPRTSRETVIHVVRKNENLEAISMRYYGSRHKWREILKVNPDVNEKRMPIGTELTIPDLNGKRRPVAAKRGNGGKARRKEPTSSGRKYTVRSGESAWSIAERHYGKKNAYKYSKLILKLNRISRPADLREGVVIQLPK